MIYKTLLYLLLLCAQSNIKKLQLRLKIFIHGLFRLLTIIIFSMLNILSFKVIIIKLIKKKSYYYKVEF